MGPAAGGHTICNQNCIVPASPSGKGQQKWLPLKTCVSISLVSVHGINFETDDIEKETRVSEHKKLFLQIA